MFCFSVFFFKQKTAYEMRISDWSSDVCSSDLNFNIDVSDFADLTPTQIAGLDVEKAYVRCDKCSAPLDLGNPELREWVARHPSRTGIRGYQIRPFSGARLNPAYVFGQLSHYQSLGYIPGWYNTVIGEAYTNADAQLPRGDIESCMLSGKIPDIPSSQRIFLGVDIGFVCHQIGRAHV